MEHGNQIFTEKKLAVGVVFRCDDTDALVIVDREQNFLRQLSGQERADDLAAIHADDGVDRLFVDVMVCERKRSVVRQTVFVLQPCDVKVMTVMGMPGRKMAMECNELKIWILSGADGLCTHDNTSLHIHVGMAAGAGGAKLLSYGFPAVVIL